MHRHVSKGHLLTTPPYGGALCLHIEGFHMEGLYSSVWMGATEGLYASVWMGATPSYGGALRLHMDGSYASIWRGSIPPYGWELRLHIKGYLEAYRCGPPTQPLYRGVGKKGLCLTWDFSSLGFWKVWLAISGSYRYLLVPTGSCRYLQVSSGSYRYLPVSTSSCRHLQVPTGI